MVEFLVLREKNFQIAMINMLKKLKKRWTEWIKGEKCQQRNEISKKN